MSALFVPVRRSDSGVGNPLHRCFYAIGNTHFFYDKKRTVCDDLFIKFRRGFDITIKGGVVYEYKIAGKL